MKHASCITASLLLLLVCFLFMPLGIVRAEGLVLAVVGQQVQQVF